MPVYLRKISSGIEDFLKIHQPDFPWATLLLDYGFQGIGGRPVPASRVEENKVQLGASMEYSAKNSLSHLRIQSRMF